LAAETADELLAAATHKTKAAIALLLAQRFPQPDMPTRIQALAGSGDPSVAGDLLGPGSPSSLARARVDSGGPPSRVTPLAPRRHGVQFTMDQEACDLLREAQELVGHELPSGDIAEVFKNALRVYVSELRKRKFAETEKPRGSRRPTNSLRHIPGHVKRAVWVRDSGQCTFISENGHRCPARKRLEFDHALELARGGRATIEGVRLRCRAHNQYTAECTFGAEFMKRKREQARPRAACAQAPTAPAPPEAAQPRPGTALGEPQIAAPPAATEAATAEDRDVTPWLQRLRFRADDIRRAAAYCEGLGDVSLEDRVRAALCYLRPRVATRHGQRFMPT
jgi:hypothetical protein